MLNFFSSLIVFYLIMGSAHSKFINLKVDLLSRIVGGTNVEFDFLIDKISIGTAVYHLDLTLPDWKYEADLFGGQVSFHQDNADSDGW